MKAAIVSLESTAIRPEEAHPAKDFEWVLFNEPNQDGDLQLAAASNGLTTVAFLARLIRTTFVIDDFRMPGLSPQLHNSNFPHFQAGLVARESWNQVPTGAVTLSVDGIGIQTRETLTQDLVIGRISPGSISLEATSFRVGDRVRFRHPGKEYKGTKRAMQDFHSA